MSDIDGIDDMDLSKDIDFDADLKSAYQNYEFKERQKRAKARLLLPKEKIKPARTMKKYWIGRCWRTSHKRNEEVKILWKQKENRI